MSKEKVDVNSPAVRNYGREFQIRRALGEIEYIDYEIISNLGVPFMKGELCQAIRVNEFLVSKLLLDNKLGQKDISLLKYFITANTGYNFCREVAYFIYNSVAIEQGPVFKAVDLSRFLVSFRLFVGSLKDNYEYITMCADSLDFSLTRKDIDTMGIRNIFIQNKYIHLFFAAGFGIGIEGLYEFKAIIEHLAYDITLGNEVSSKEYKFKARNLVGRKEAVAQLVEAFSTNKDRCLDLYITMKFIKSFEITDIEKIPEDKSSFLTVYENHQFFKPKAMVDFSRFDKISAAVKSAPVVPSPAPIEPSKKHFLKKAEAAVKIEAEEFVLKPKEGMSLGFLK